MDYPTKEQVDAEVLKGSAASLEKFLSVPAADAAGRWAITTITVGSVVGVLERRVFDAPTWVCAATLAITALIAVLPLLGTSQDGDH